MARPAIPATQEPLLVDVTTSWTDVVGALGTAGAFLIAAGVFGYEVRQRWRLRMRGQAEQVTAWVTRSKTPGVPSEIHVRNASDGMIYAIFTKHYDNSLGEIDMAVAPGETAVYPSNFDPDLFRSIPVRVEFVDMKGRSWERDKDGQLRRRPLEDNPDVKGPLHRWRDARYWRRQGLTQSVPADVPSSGDESGAP